MLLAVLVVISIVSTATAAMLAGVLFFHTRPAAFESAPFPLPIKRAISPKKAKSRVIANDDAAAFRAEAKEQAEHKLS